MTWGVKRRVAMMYNYEFFHRLYGSLLPPALGVICSNKLTHNIVCTKIWHEVRLPEEPYTVTGRECMFRK